MVVKSVLPTLLTVQNPRSSGFRKSQVHGSAPMAVVMRAAVRIAMLSADGCEFMVALGMERIRLCWVHCTGGRTEVPCGLGWHAAFPCGNFPVLERTMRQVFSGLLSGSGPLPNTWHGTAATMGWDGHAAMNAGGRGCAGEHPELPTLCRPAPSCVASRRILLAGWSQFSP